MTPREAIDDLTKSLRLCEKWTPKATASADAYRMAIVAIEDVQKLRDRLVRAEALLRQCVGESIGDGLFSLGLDVAIASSPSDYEKELIDKVDALTKAVYAFLADAQPSSSGGSGSGSTCKIDDGVSGTVSGGSSSSSAR